MANNISKPGTDASLGALLLDAGKINSGDIDRIIALQRQKKLQFGAAAKALGLVKDEDIQKALAKQFDFPFLGGKEYPLSSELFAAYNPFSPQVEALRAIRGQIMLNWLIDYHKTIVLVSPQRGEGRSVMAANLAIVFSQLGEKTLLIDADLRNPRQHELFNLQSSYGLSDLLAGRADLDSVTKIPFFRNLSVLHAGTIPPNPVELVSRRLNSLILKLQSEFDIILIDTPATEEGIDAQVIASYCIGALLVARQHKTKIKDVQILTESLRNVGSQCLGSILTV